MLSAFAHRLLPLLQLTRMALVFTAISNSLCTYLLYLRRQHSDGSLLEHVRAAHVILIALISIGLYGFGMSLNDIIDRRRDSQLAAHRPLPSGRVGVVAAHVICWLLAALALAAAIIYSATGPMRWAPLLLALWVAFLISFYDFAGKYLVATGLLTLGLIRFFHAVIPAPWFPLLWHPLFLFTHVTILSAVAYDWEQKRPALTRLHWLGVLGGVAAINVIALSTTYARAHDLRIQPALALPALAALFFIVLGWWIRRNSPTPREAGQTLMLTGLLWLILYDSLFAAAYVGWAYAVALLMLLPLSYLAVHLMRWSSKLLQASQAPAYKRVRTSLEMARGGTTSGDNK